MTRKQFFGTALGGLAAPAVAQPARRNLVFILSDDHSATTMGCAGHPWLKTPAMDRMARDGVLFPNAFVTTALCSPSRASILTGRYVHSHEVTDNVTPFAKGAITFPEILRQNGYRTAFMGKWHMGGDTDAPQPGFDRWISFRGQGVYNDPVLNFDGERRKVPGYLTDLLTGEAERFIASSAGRPFCLYLSHKAVHGFCEPASRHRDLYAREPIPYPKSMANTEENYRGKPDWVRRQRNSWHGVDGMYNGKISFEQNYRDYCRTLMSLDESIERVFQALDEKQLLNDTLVIYMGDNGFQFGEHGLIDKRTMYEASIRVPMLAHCPDLFDRGRRETGLALNLDIGPTLLDAASVRVPPSMHGRSLLHLLRGGSDWRSEFVYEYFWERDYPQTPTVIGLRTDRYSYMEYHGVDDLNELYDTQSDPDQMNNLLADVRTGTRGGSVFAQIRDPERRKLVGDLRNRIHGILRATGGRREPTWSGGAGA
jgi:N-acetylglucosamine-6-sulfatase